MAITISNNTFSGGNIGIQSDGDVDIIARDNVFRNVKKPFDIRNARSVDIQGTRITDYPDAKSKNQNTNKSFSGWTPTNGPALPALCEDCGSVFPSTLYDISTPQFYSRDNQECCPVCDSDNAKLSDGLFNLALDVIRVIHAPNNSRRMISQLGKISDQVTAGKIGTEEALDAYQKAAPELSKYIQSAWHYGQAAVLFITFAITVATYFSNKEDTGLRRRSIDTQERQFSEQIRHNRSLERTAERTLEALSKSTFRSGDKPEYDGEDSARSGPTEGKSTGKASPIKVRPNKKEKVRKNIKHKKLPTDNLPLPKARPEEG